MKTNHHTRQGYEQLLINICHESRSDYPADLYKYSNVELLKLINNVLKSNECHSYYHDEMEDILYALA